ncbi:MAG: TOMM precursor leader peptide-binding protein, partial [Chloroflexi bacterium]|nr:TOMM precursor leader peptide-binding protein [Chloroflexota bacterium]
MTRLQLNSSASVLNLHDRIVVHSDVGTFVLEGRDADALLSDVMPLLDGSRSAEEIIHDLPAYRAEDLRGVLESLTRCGLLETSDTDERWRSRDRFFQTHSHNASLARESLRGAYVLISGLEPWGAVAATELAEAGIGGLHLVDERPVCPSDLLGARIWRPRDLGRGRARSLAARLARRAPWTRFTTSRRLPASITHVVGALADDDLRAARGLAAWAHAARLPSVFGTLRGQQAIIGPVFRPAATAAACWNCCRLRLLANLEHPQDIQALHQRLLAGDAAPAGWSALPPAAGLTGHLLSLEVLKLVTGCAPGQADGQVLVFDTLTQEATRHTAIKLPWCEVCGGASKAVIGRGPRPLSSASTAGALREALAGWVDARTGIISRLVAVPPQAGGPWRAEALTSGYADGRYVPAYASGGSGKGTTEVEAMVGAAAEAIERYSASQYRRSNFRRASLKTLGDDALDPRGLCLYEAHQYEQPEFHYAAFDPDREYDWMQARWLHTGEPTWVPALLALLGLETRPEELFGQVTSSGLA